MLGLRLEHPNVVRTFKHSTVLVQVRCLVARIPSHSLRQALLFHQPPVGALTQFWLRKPSLTRNSVVIFSSPPCPLRL